MTKAIRILLTLGLIIGTYFEAGIFTAMSLFLIFATVEIIASFLQVYIKKNNVNLKELFKK